jgi:hypothetical protein
MARHDPEAIMLDFMQPIRPAWRTFCGRGKAWFYEVSTQTQQHDVTVSDEALERPLVAQPGRRPKRLLTPALQRIERTHAGLH